MQPLINYAKKNIFGIAVSCAVIAFTIDTFSHSSKFSLTRIFAIILFLAAVYLKEKEKKRQLKKKGLTPGDITNIAFVKDWEVTRKTGIARYCLVEGGLMTGVILFVPVSFIIFFTSGLEVILASFGNLLIAASASFALSYLTGAAIYFFRWKTNERRFMNLTDPLKILAR